MANKSFGRRCTGEATRHGVLAFSRAQGQFISVGVCGAILHVPHINFDTSISQMLLVVHQSWVGGLPTHQASCQAHVGALGFVSCDQGARRTTRDHIPAKCVCSPSDRQKSQLFGGPANLPLAVNSSQRRPKNNNVFFICFYHYIELAPVASTL